MTDADIQSLRLWAESHAPAGCLRARQVLCLLDRDAERIAELADTDAHLAELRERLDRLRLVARPFSPVPHPCA